MEEKYAGRNREQIKELRVHWVWGYWLGVAGMVGASGLSGSTATTVISYPRADNTTIQFAIAVWVVSIFALLRSAYMLSMLKGTRNGLAAWGSLLAPPCYGVLWYWHYLGKQDRYPYPKTEKEVAQERSEEAVRENYDVRPGDYAQLIGGLPPQTSARFNAWCLGIDQRMEAMGLPDRAVDLRSKSLWFGFMNNLSPEEFIDWGLNEEKNLPTEAELEEFRKSERH